ncbi:MAG: aminotransferase [Crocinitomicaceae bacterium]|nr:aminotransferase [Crocinitomicaceae bacterium]|tara:strand:- start:13903 stop:15147 length:1245 start_codon:yes stop_codon:yes gene_type:complete
MAAIPLLPISENALLNTSKLINDEIDKQAALADNTEDFWSWVQQSYTSSSNFINLNNGGVSPQPLVVQEAFKRYTDICNEGPSYYMWRIFRKNTKAVKEKLANLGGVNPDEIIINRNTTEALDTIINGLTLKAGDEIVVSTFDYPNMKNVWKMREKRDGIKLNWVWFPVPCEDDDTMVKAYTDKFTSKTKLVHITHLVNWTGQILPVRKIADAARAKGIEVLVDGAHSFAHLDFKIPDLNCDYFGTSLHKWLCAPFGTGMLYVKKEKISNLWPSFPGENPDGDSIVKFGNLGTRSVPSEMAVGNAINFHLSIGAKRKQERLAYLKNYWINQVKDTENVIIYTSTLSEYAGALGVFGIKGMGGIEIAKQLEQKFTIHTTNIKIEEIDGIRITPHIYTREYDLDRLISAIKTMASK